MKKEYLGDGVYVEVEHGMLKLTAARLDGTDTIYLESDVYFALTQYFERRQREAAVEPAAEDVELRAILDLVDESKK